MTKREAKKIKTCLKAEQYEKEKDKTKIAEGEITEIRDIDTKHGEKTVISFKDGKEEKDIFVNNFSMTNLIEAYTDNDEKWLGKKIVIKKETDKAFNKAMLVINKK